MSCQKYEDLLIDYIEGTLSPDEKLAFQSHLQQCSHCQQEYDLQIQLFQQLDEESNHIIIPKQFMEQVQQNLEQQPIKTNWKVRLWRIGIVAAILSLLLFSTDLTTGLISQMQQWMQGFIGKQSASVGPTLGKEVNISAMDQNIKITITHVVADDYVTNLYYEIEDQNSEELQNVEMFIYGQSMEFANQLAVWGKEEKPNYEIVPIQNERTKGIISLQPIAKTSAVLQLQIHGVMKIVEDVRQTETNGNQLHSNEVISGNWHFKIPLEKHKVKQIQLNQSVEVDGVQVTIDAIKLAPTRTTLYYSYQNTPSNDQSSLKGKTEHILIDIRKLSNGSKSYAQSPLGLQMSVSSSGTYLVEANYESMYYDDVDEIVIHFSSIRRNVKWVEQYPIDVEQPFPQSFEYLGTTVTIEQMQIGNPTTISVLTEEDPHRLFDSVEVNFLVKNEDLAYLLYQQEEQREFMVVDRAGNIIKQNELITYDEFLLHDGRFLTIKQTFRLTFEEKGQEICPIYMRIDGYTQSKALDERFTVKLR